MWRYLKNDLELLAWIQSPIESEAVIKSGERLHSNIYLNRIILVSGV